MRRRAESFPPMSTTSTARGRRFSTSSPKTARNCSKPPNRCPPATPSRKAPRIRRFHAIAGCRCRRILIVFSPCSQVTAEKQRGSRYHGGRDKGAVLFAARGPLGQGKFMHYVRPLAGLALAAAVVACLGGTPAHAREVVAFSDKTVSAGTLGGRPPD